MSINPKYFNIIKTPNDNNCLLRSCGNILNNQLLSYGRNRDGKPVNKQLSDYEDNCTKFCEKQLSND